MNPTFAGEFPSFSGNPKPQTDRVAVILAGGDGTRLRSLTRAITGDERPKQFCPILNGETLLDITRRRVSSGIKPENTFFSLTKKCDIGLGNTWNGHSQGCHSIIEGTAALLR